jgi:cytochrome P450
VSTEIADIDITAVDLMDAEFHRDGPPYELLDRMRRECPVHRNALADGSHCWALTRHDDVSAVSRDTETFSSHKAGIFLNPDQVFLLDITRNLLLYKDPPEHTKYRKILQTAFVPKTVAAMEGMVRARVTRVIDAFIERGECDFVDDFAVPIPLGVLTELMGVPDEDIPQFAKWTDEIEAAQRSPESNSAIETLGEMSAYLHGQIERQAAEGIEDSLVMRLRNAEVEGERLTDAEILVFFGLLAFAGNDTTRNTIATGTRALLEHPTAYRELVEDRELIPNAVEEILRYTSVVKYFVRTATTDTEIRGQAIPEGDKVVMWYTAASRDGEVHTDPHAFDIHREKIDHKAFGGGGRHFCLGAGLARLELRVMLEEMARRMPDLQLAGPVELLPSAWANGLVHMPVRFSPGEPRGAQ